MERLFAYMPLLLKFSSVLVIHCTCRFHAVLPYFTSLTLLAVGVSSRARFLLHMDGIAWKYSHDKLPLDVSELRNYPISDTAVLAVMASSFLCWDMIITLGDEIKYIWCGPWMHIKSLYVSIRLLALLAQGMGLAFMFVRPTHHCQASVSVQVIATMLLICSTQLLMTLRTCALYRDIKIIYHGIRALWVLEATTVIATAIVTKIGESVCDVNFAPTGASQFAVPIPALIFDFLLLVLTLTKFHLSLRGYWGRVPLVTKFIQDGIWAYVLPTSVIAVNLGLNMSNSPWAAAGSLWICTVNAFSGYRLTLRTVKMLQTTQDQNQEPMELSTLC